MSRVLGAVMVGIGLFASASVAWAHSDDPKALHRIGPYEGDGWKRGAALVNGLGVAQRGGLGFPAQNVVLRSWLTIPELNAPAGSEGADCWGWTSPGGKEIAIMTMTTSTAFVDVTDPDNPVVLGTFGGPTSLWRDAKVFQDRCYVVTEGGGGLQVFDLSGIDDPTPTIAELGSLSDVGTGATHNVVINEDSGYLYRTGGADNGLRIYSLTQNPDGPVFVGQWQDRYVHDAQVVSYTEGPFAGREIAFCCTGFNGGSVETGFEILDVTDKNNIFQLDRLVYPQGAYSHQVWISADKRFAYLNDELDENGLTESTTIVFDISDLTDISVVNRATINSNAITHNNYVHERLLFAANYQAGLRVFDLADQANPVEVAFFDTFPSGDAATFNSLWSVYPYFGSGTVIGSDIEGGLFVWSLENITPLVIDVLADSGDLLDGGRSFELGVSGRFGAEVDPSSVTLNFRSTPVGGTPGAFTGVAASPSAVAGVLDATIPQQPCGTTVEWFFTAATPGGELAELPVGADGGNGTLFSETLFITDTTFADDAESDTGWIVGAPSDTATTGVWVRVDPNGTNAQPEDDASDPSTRCWITGQGTPGASQGENDVDDGVTTLTSPQLDATARDGDATLSLAVWYSNSTGNAPNEDSMPISISNDNGNTWTTLEVITSTNGMWETKRYAIADFVTPTDEIRVRFEASDLFNGSIVEAGVDDLTIEFETCPAIVDCPSDANGDGVTTTGDITFVVSNLGAGSPGASGTPGDVNGDGVTTTGDITFVVSNLGTQCPS
ncbi:MAG: choice-of-anchor B family protein [Planctomycetota bacterium]